jgi:Fic family protein
MKNKFTEEYLDDLLVRMAHNSTAIEGNTLTQPDTVSILLHNFIPKLMSEREYFEVKNYKKTVAFLLSNSEELSPKLMKNYHKLIMENLDDNNGEFKKIGNLIVGSNFETAKPYQVPILLQEWSDNYNFRIKNAKTNEEKIEIILEQHIKFEKIHPFSDGNGRTGRMIIIDNCLKENLIPIVIPKEEKNKYITLLATENSKEFAKWGIELQKNELYRMECFKNKILDHTPGKKVNPLLKTLKKQKELKNNGKER